MKRPDLWPILLKKAEEDEYAVDHLIDLPDSPNAVVGFHLQQAAEKLLKALLLIDHKRAEWCPNCVNG